MVQFSWCYLPRSRVSRLSTYFQLGQVIFVFAWCVYSVRSRHFQFLSQCNGGIRGGMPCLLFLILCANSLALSWNLIIMRFERPNTGFDSCMCLYMLGYSHILFSFLQLLLVVIYAQIRVPQM